MAGYRITRNCGHEEDVNIAGPYKDRERKAEYEASKLCRACWLAQQREAATAEAGENDWPVIAGTEKQVAWAMRLRSEAMAEVARFRGELAAATVPAERETGRQAALAAVDAVEAEALAQVEARYWIDRRGTWYEAARTAAREALAQDPVIQALKAKADAKKAEAEAAERAESERVAAERAAEAADRKAEREAREATADEAAAGFEPVRRRVEGETLTVWGADGRMATGHCWDGDYYIEEIGGVALDPNAKSAAAIAERVARLG